jgi:ABC-type multidrug transport system fused ATPase/permease subunit
MRTELQMKELSFGNAFNGSLEDNDLLFGTLMIIFDFFLYIAIGYACERFLHGELDWFSNGNHRRDIFYKILDDNKFYEVERKRLGQDVGGQLVNVSKTYADNRQALKNVSVEFKRDEITCLLGRNGAGKSTTM